MPLAGRKARRRDADLAIGRMDASGRHVCRSVRGVDYLAPYCASETCSSHSTFLPSRM